MKAKRLAPIVLTETERDLLVEALDSHQYWQLSDSEYRRDGYVTGKGSEHAENRKEIRACDALGVKLLELKAPAAEVRAEVRQTACRHCGQDIEGIRPFKAGQWRDRGNNTTCPTPAGDKGQKHAPIKEAAKP
ncbi:MAG: hypothetical protein ABWY78_06440 [Microvirga sp.]